jgi:hypothetical protein
MAPATKPIFRLTLLAAIALVSGCYQFHLVGPSEPDPVTPPQSVSVTVEYRQPGSCAPDSSDCQVPVVFSGSWMNRAATFSLTRVGTTQAWRGTAYAVPVNFPPRGGPYSVQVYDPLLKNDPCQGYTAQRLVVGGESVRSLADENTPQARGLIYVDTEGHGRNVY